MGQYHRPISVEKRQFLDPHYIGAGLKAWEQIVNVPGTCAALAALLAVRPGNAPGDLGNFPLVGEWAGTRILNVGDYAEDTDIEGFEGPPLSVLYGLCTKEAYLKDYMRTYEEILSEIQNAKYVRSPPHTPASMEKEALGIFESNQNFLETAHKNGGFFTDVTPSIIGCIEHANSIRYFGSGWRDRIGVEAKPLPGGKFMFTAKKPKNKEDAEFRKRMGFDPELVNRPPQGMIGDVTPLKESEVELGQIRVFANLDRKEFIDPVVFGEVPTLAGVIRSDEPGSASAVMTLLFHRERRGGGDLTGESRMLSSWMNNRLVMTSEYSSETLPSTDEVKATFRNISDESLALLKHELEH